MITEYLYQFLVTIFDTGALDMHFAVDFLAPALSSLICTIPVSLLLRPVMGERVSKVCYIALNIALFAVQAFSINGGVL